MSNFYTDVIQKDPRFSSVARVADMALLEPLTRAKVEAVLASARERFGIKLMVWETYRSTYRQLALFRQGATKLSKAGVHGYGLAADIVKDDGGQPSWKGDFTFLARLAQENGLISGQDWGHPGVPTDFVDACHVQRIAVAMQPQLFAGTWFPGEAYDPYRAV